MTDKKNMDTSCAAFPGPVQAEQSVDIHEGMTLRDYFAAAALPESMQWKGTDKAAEVARMAYQIADAMLKRRGEK